MNQRKIARELGVSDAYLSQILSGVYEPSKKMAKRMAAFTGRTWTDFLTMTPAEIRAALFAQSTTCNACSTCSVFINSQI
jgi:transcriptional regulator with XRE-family HTH domain